MPEQIENVERVVSQKLEGREHLKKVRDTFKQ